MFSGPNSSFNILEYSENWSDNFLNSIYLIVQMKAKTIWPQYSLERVAWYQTIYYNLAESHTGGYIWFLIDLFVLIPIPEKNTNRTFSSTEICERISADKLI